MILSIIAAVSDNNAIGINNSLPWSLPNDLKHFKSLTLNHSVIMGRNTFNSIGKPLPNRKNIVVSYQTEQEIPNVINVNSLKDALNLVKNEDEVFVIGGASLYEQVLPIANRLYITQVHGNIPGDRFFPTIDDAIWKVTDTKFHQQDKTHAYDYSFLIYNHI